MMSTYCHSRGISQWGFLAQAVGGAHPGAAIEIQLPFFSYIIYMHYAICIYVLCLFALVLNMTFAPNSLLLNPIITHNSESRKENKQILSITWNIFQYFLK